MLRSPQYFQASLPVFMTWVTVRPWKLSNSCTVSVQSYTLLWHCYSLHINQPKALLDRSSDHLVFSVIFISATCTCGQANEYGCTQMPYLLLSALCLENMSLLHFLLPCPQCIKGWTFYIWHMPALPEWKICSGRPNTFAKDK